MSSTLPTLAAFHATRERQCVSMGRTYSPTDRRASETLYKAASLALGDIERDDIAVTFRVCSMPTGYGKTTAAVAFMVEAAKADPTFAAVYVCKERKFVEQIADLLDKLAVEIIGSPIALVYTSAHSDNHDRNAKDAKDYFERTYNGFVPTRPLVHRDDLKQARIVVVTHKAWLDEIKANADRGIRRFRNKRRLSFVDEQPDMVRVIEMRPTLVQAFQDRASKAKSGPDVAPWLASIVNAMNAVMESKPDKFFTVPAVVKPEDGVTFAPLIHTPSLLKPFVAPGSTRDEAAEQIHAMTLVCRYIVAASNMAAFYAKRDKMFWAYEAAVQPGPGTVLLDATADLGPIVSFLPGVQRVSSHVLTVHYGNLKVVHVELPKQFWNAKKTLATARDGKDYCEWMIKVVLSLSKPEDRILVVAHKDVFNYEFFQVKGWKALPLIEGRHVSTTHWGTGIGSNQWKDCTVVFEFGEWWQPRGATVGEVHGYKDTPVSEIELAKAVGRKTSDRNYMPKGDYRVAAENHLLRWAMQLAARGSVRNIDGDGNCGRMKLVTTMQYSRLLRHLSRLFPGTDTPRSIVIPLGDGPATEKPSGRDALARLLIEATEPSYSSKEVAKLTGLAVSNLKREFQSQRVNTIALAHGWTLASNRRVGKKGKGLNLVKADWLAALVPQSACA